MIFKNELTVDVHDVDHNGVARASSLMRYIQTAAQDQLTANGMSYDELREMGVGFILSRIKMEFTESVHCYDRLSAITYPCDSRAYSFLRCYALERNGVTIGRAVSIWALVNVKTHGLVKVNDFDFPIPTHEPHELTLTRFFMPSTLVEVGTYTVNYGDLDQNCHMNNTRYPDMYSNFLPLDNRRIRSISINYLNEAPRGARLHVLMAKTDDNLYYIRTVREDGKVNTEAEIELCDI